MVRRSGFGRVGTKGGFGMDMAVFKNCTGAVFTLNRAVLGRFDASHGLEGARQGPCRALAVLQSTKATRSDVVGRKISFEILGGLREPSSPEESRKEGLLGLPFKCHATGLPEFLQCCIDVALLAVPPDSFLDLLFALPVPALPPLAATMPAGSFTPGSIPASFATTTFSRCLVAGPPECETE